MIQYLHLYRENELVSVAVGCIWSVCKRSQVQFLASSAKMSSSAEKEYSLKSGLLPNLRPCQNHNMSLPFQLLAKRQEWWREWWLTEDLLSHLLGAAVEIGQGLVHHPLLKVVAG